VTKHNILDQTAKLDTHVVLSNVDEDKSHDYANINIPGIGSGHFKVKYFANNDSGNPSYNTIITGLPCQTAKDDNSIVTADDVCNPYAHALSNIISVLGIGPSYLTITMIN
jgi:hypothetical protein